MASMTRKTDRTVTTDEQRQAIARTAKRHGIIEASRRHGRPYHTCYTICARLGVKPRPYWPPVKRQTIERAKRLRRKLSLVKVGKILGVSHTQVRNWTIAA
jgi:transposase-like protein